MRQVYVLDFQWHEEVPLAETRGQRYSAQRPFTFTIIGPTKKTTETVKLKAALAAGAAVDVTKSIPAKNVTGCSPTS